MFEHSEELFNKFSVILQHIVNSSTTFSDLFILSSDPTHSGRNERSNLQSLNPKKQKSPNITMLTSLVANTTSILNNLYLTQPPPEAQFLLRLKTAKLVHSNQIVTTTNEVLRITNTWLV
jgi:hypothetical protein